MEVAPDAAVAIPIKPPSVVPVVATAVKRFPPTIIAVFDAMDVEPRVTVSATDERTPPTTTTPKPVESTEFSISHAIEHVDKQTPVDEVAAVFKVSKVNPALRPVVFVADTYPTCLALASVALVTADPDVDAISEIFTSPFASLAALADVTDRNPAVSVVTATSAMRCFIVLLDICFLSLVKLGNFPISARRSFDLLILFPYGTHV